MNKKTKNLLWLVFFSLFFSAYSNNVQANTIMISPNGGEIWKKGEAHEITWSTEKIASDKINIILYKGNNCSLNNITGKQICGWAYSPALALEVPNTGQYTWTISTSLTNGNDYRMAIQNPNNLPFTLQSDASFSIVDVRLDACTGSNCNIYRFWSNAKQGHFFTQSAAEANGIIAGDSSWKYEGIAYGAFSSQTTNAMPIYRFWSGKKQHHFYTASADEKNYVIANDPSWKYESIAYYAYASEQPNTTAVYRFWSDKKQGHFFTSSVAEKDSIITNDHSWKYEGIAWYVPTN
ncbi:MAG: Ser-Thr-rich GPI-anchored membrane family protein [Parcubacteria group bacterium]|jgi:hypothetical protein